MICQKMKYTGTGECGSFINPNPIKGIEIKWLTNKSAELTAVMQNDSKRPVDYVEAISINIDGEEIRFERLEKNVFKSSEELF